MNWWIIIAAWTLINLVIGAWILWHWCMRRCDWCHKLYLVWSSSSSSQNVFCSYKCNYWDLRGYLAEKMHIDIAEVEDYLSRHGYVHPDYVEVK